MGAKIPWRRHECIRIEGVKELHGADHTVIPDRIEAGTYMIAAAMTGGGYRCRECSYRTSETFDCQIA